MGNGRPINTDGDLYTDPASYNPYDKGYKSGAQSSLFIGPIWLEEVVSLQLGTGTEDIPVYPYSRPYYNTLLLGNYMVSGQFSINYSESDYLLRIIDAARNTSIQESELKSLIQGRKSLFEDSLASREMDNSQINRVRSYVERISREVETSSMNSNGKLDPKAFELTIITGNLYDDDQILEIYEDVKINRTNKIISNDDNVLIEIYTFIGKKKPDRLVKKEITVPSRSLSRANLLAMTEELIDQLTDVLVAKPKFEVTSTRVRTDEMISADRLGTSGHLTKNTRGYGKSASFTEIIYAFEYHQKISTYKDTSTNADIPIKSNTPVKVYSEANPDGIEVNSYLTCPRLPKKTGIAFDNYGGRIIYPNREGCAKFIAAIGPVEIVQTNFKRGGSIALPRYNVKDFGIGSYYPPSVLSIDDNPDAFDYNDKDISNLTSSTLWCSGLGFRTSRSYMGDDYSEEDVFTASISQPLNSMSLIELPNVTWKMATDTFTISVPAPIPIDYVNTNKGKMKTKGEMELGTSGNYIKFTMSKTGIDFGDSDKDSVELTGPIKTEYTAAQENMSSAMSAWNEEEMGPKYVPESPVNNLELYEGTTIQVFHQMVNLKESSGGLPADLDPYFLEMSFKAGSPEIAASLHKSLYVQPMIFIDPSIISVESIAETGAPLGSRTYAHINGNDSDYLLDYTALTVPSYFNMDSDNRLYGKEAAEFLAYLLQLNGNRDDSCQLDIMYDYYVSDLSGYFDSEKDIKIDAVYFLNDRTGEVDKVINSSNGNVLKKSVVGVNEYIHVFWVVGVIPNLQLPTGVNEDSSGVTIEHDISERSGRKLEIYNITRCDTLLHNGEALFSKSIPTQIKNAIMNAFSDLLNIDKLTNSYTYPVKSSWGRFAGFISGYSFTVDTATIASQIEKCTFTEDLHKFINWGTDKGGNFEITLKTAFDRANGSINEAKDTSDISIETMVINTLRTKVEALGGRIKDYGQKGSMTVEMEVLIPVKDVVKLGLTEDGYYELKELTAMNEAAAGIKSTSFNIGGYDA